MKRLALSLFVVALTATIAGAQPFQVGVDGFAGDTNNWPPGENPSFAIDGLGQKYLNFGKENTGILVTLTDPELAPTSIELWTANDSEERDPASFAIYGTSDPITASAPGDLQGGFTLIAEDTIGLPSSRNAGGASPLLPENSATESFVNFTSYLSYMIVFPTLKDSASANSMQVADIQLYDAVGAPLLSPTDAILGGQLIPEPSSCVLLLLGLVALFLGRFRR